MKSDKIGFFTFLIFSLLTFGSSFYFGFVGKATEMGVMVVAGAIIMAFSNIDKLKRFKGAGFEAVMRDVENATKEAYATADSMKKLGKTIVCSLHPILTHEGRWASMDVSQKFELKKQLDSISDELALTDEKIILSSQELNRMIAREGAESIMHAVLNSEKISKDLKSKIEIGIKNSSGPVLVAKEIREILGNELNLESTIKERVVLYESIEGYTKI